MDWGQAACTGAIVAVGWGATHIANTARFGQRVENLEKLADSTAKRFDEVEETFKELPVKFVPRAELSETLGAIRASQEIMMRWLERILFKSPGAAVDAGRDKS